MTRKTLCLLIILQLHFWSTTAQSKSVILRDIAVTTTQNQLITFEKLSINKPLYLKIWASWCQPCRKQMPHFQKSYEKHGKDVDFIAINLGINESMSAIKNMQQTFSLTMPIVIDHTGQLARLFDLKGTPLNILIDKEGNVIYRSHEISDVLDNTLRLLSKSINPELPSIKSGDNDEKTPLDIHETANRPTVLFFTSAWCDWYLKESRPKMSMNCIKSQNIISELYRNNPDLNLTGILSRLWTTEKESTEYKKKYRIKYPLYIDKKNELFINYEIKTYPTLIVLKNSKLKLKLEDFNNVESIFEKLSQF